MSMEAFTFTVHIEPADEGGFVAYFPDLPGCQTQGESVDEILVSAKEALAGYIQASRENGTFIPHDEPRSKQIGFEFPLTASVPR